MSRFHDSENALAQHFRHSRVDLDQAVPVLCIRDDVHRFGSGAAAGAFATEFKRAYSLAIPVLLLVIVLLLCEQKPVRARA